VSTLRRIRAALVRARRFTSSPDYWERHYAAGGTSGGGSYGRVADFKADFLNRLVAERDVRSVVEWGCGDGNQLSLARYPSYLGLDVSRTAVELCRTRFAGDPTRSFELVDSLPTREQAGRVRADLAMSLDVIYHLIEQEVFERHLQALFESADRLVVIFAVDEDRPVTAAHVLFRSFTGLVAREQPEWSLVDRQPCPYPNTGDDLSGSDAEFFVYERK